MKGNGECWTKWGVLKIEILRGEEVNKGRFWLQFDIREIKKLEQNVYEVFRDILRKMDRKTITANKAYNSFNLYAFLK